MFDETLGYVCLMRNTASKVEHILLLVAVSSKQRGLLWRNGLQ